MLIDDNSDKSEKNIGDNTDKLVIIDEHLTHSSTDDT